MLDVLGDLWFFHTSVSVQVSVTIQINCWFSRQITLPHTWLRKLMQHNLPTSILPLCQTKLILIQKSIWLLFYVVFFFLFVELLWYKNKKYLNFFSERNWEVHVLSSALPSHLLFSWTTNHQTESRLTPAIIFDSQRWTTATKAHKNDEIYFCLMRIFLQHEMDDINETWEEMGEK